GVGGDQAKLARDPQGQVARRGEAGASNAAAEGGLDGRADRVERQEREGGRRAVDGELEDGEARRPGAAGVAVVDQVGAVGGERQPASYGDVPGLALLAGACGGRRRGRR